MEDRAPFEHPLRVAELPTRSETRIELRPDAAERERIAAALGLSALRKLRFECRIAAIGRRDWRLEGDLGATVVQPCVVTLEPVTTRIDIDVERIYTADADMPDEAGGETEMPEDERVEPLGEVIDPGRVMVEALALALPDYPRAEGAELGEAVYTEPGRTPMRDEDTKPFAGLSALRDKLKKER